MDWKTHEFYTRFELTLNNHVELDGDSEQLASKPAGHRKRCGHYEIFQNFVAKQSLRIYHNLFLLRKKFIMTSHCFEILGSRTPNLDQMKRGVFRKIFLQNYFQFLKFSVISKEYQEQKSFAMRFIVSWSENNSQ